MTDDKRGGARGRTLLGGILIFSASDFTADCTVRNLAKGGARVRVPETVTLSLPLTLIILQTGEAFDAEVAWVRGGEVGLKFVGPLNLDDPVDGRGRLARRLWLERRAR